MRGRPGGRKFHWIYRSRSFAGENGRHRKAHDAAETRLLEAKASYTEASTRKVELEAEKLVEEIARQPAEAERARARIAREEAETRETEFSLLRGQALLIVFLLMVVLVLALALVNPALLETIGRSLPWVPR